ncbi:MAG: hypothetical protein COZ06_19585, partial [Armatimonadetes bacterium CG_4_10_14_3_um_filter_66_18]
TSTSVCSQPSRVYVDQSNPQASDAGEGTAQQPFQTINRAARAVTAGERVLVKAGIYREEVQLLRGGEGPDRMVSFEAKPGHAVIIRGSCVLPKAWRPSPSPPAAAAPALWTLRLPKAEFAKCNPFSLRNLDERDGHTHPWEASEAGAKTAPYTHRRGLLFQEGRRLRQVTHREELAGEEGTYWVEDDGWVLHARPFGGTDPNTVLMEATNRRQCFAPKAPGVSSVRLQGFLIEQVGNAFSYPVEAAVSPSGGRHWIIEDNVIRHVNADGINLGGYVWIWGGDRASTNGWDCFVRRNTLADCGVSGLKGLTPVNCVIEDNVLDHIGWQNVELGYDNGGMKLLVCKNALVRHNLVRDVVAGPGIWLDWDNANCRVSQNVVVDVQSKGGGIFLEASEQTNWVDHNVIWNIEGNGVYQHDCDGLRVFNNLIGHCTDAAVRMQVCTTRKRNGQEVTCKGNEVRDNVLVDNRLILFLGDPDNSSDHNVIGDSQSPGALAAWQQSSGKDAHSQQRPLQITLDRATLNLGWAAPEAFTARPGALPGPFTKDVLLSGTIRLFEALNSPRDGAAS